MFKKITIDHIFAALVFLIGFVTYWSTVAPTTSFWDCGEFIACSYTMGVPHPPGSPLFLLMGRVFTLLPTAADIGFRVNLSSALLSAFSLLFLYLATVRLIRMFKGPDKDSHESFLVGAGAFIGTLVLGFSYSFWFNSVEAEVYSAATFFTAIVVWLILKWTDYGDRPRGDKYLLVIAYMIGLATGVHLLNLLALWTVFQIVYFHKFKFSWTGFLLQIVLASVSFLIIYPGIIKYIPIAMKNVSVWTPVILLAALIGLLRWAAVRKQRILALSTMAVLLVILGYSTYGVIFVRSKLNPTIDENNPDNLDRLVYYLNREQYGDAPILDRRWNGDPKYSSKADFFWRYQVHYMYTRYFLWQFVGQEGDFQGAGVDFSKFWALPLLLGFLGMALHFQKDGKRAFSVLTLFFMAGYGIILYLNQEDPQPRERDYSYVGSFYAYAIWIGMGAYYLLDLTDKWLSKRPGMRKAGVYAAAVVILIAVPGNMLLKNYDLCKRSGEYVAWDYSHNILQSCEKDAIIFTNGDNDTFPLWFLQEVEGVRKDVRVVNLSLLNTGWYIKQLKQMEPVVPISFSDDYIDKYLDGHDWPALKRRYWPDKDPETNQERSQEIAIATPEGQYQWKLPATMNIPLGPDDPGKPNFLRVQDVMILNIMSTNQGKKPIYFAVTVSNSNFIGLRDYLSMDGLAFRLTPEKRKMIDPEKLKVNLFENFSGHFRNLDNPQVHFSDNIQKLLQNYRSAFLQLAYYHYTHRTEGINPEIGMSPDERYAQWDALSSSAKVVLILDWMEKVMPEKIIPLNNDEVSFQIGKMYYDAGRPDRLEERLANLTQTADKWEQLLSYAALYHQWLNDSEKAKAALDKAYALSQDSISAITEIAGLAGRIGEVDRAMTMLKGAENRSPSFEQRVQIGNSYYMMNQDSAALRVYQQLYKENGADGQVVGGMLTVLERMGNFPQAMQVLDDWLKLHPQDDQAAQKKDNYLRMLAGK